MQRVIDHGFYRGLLGLLALGLSASVSAQGFDPSPAQPLDHIVAVVEEDVIMASELRQRMQLIAQQIQTRGGLLPDEAILIRQVAERLALERLQLQEARRIGIRIDDLTLNNAVEAIARDNQLSLPEFREQLLAQGLNFAQFREQVRDELTIAQLRRRQVENRIQVTEQEIDDLIASESGAIDSGMQYRLQHILVALPEGASPQDIQSARAKAEALRQEAQAGADFTELALRASSSQHALEGGDLGWRGAAQIPTLFARHVVLMRVGDISEVVRSPSGFHLIRLAERRGGERANITQIRARHILIQPSEILSDTEARERLLVLRQRILDGDDFATLAQAHSQDRGSALRGGDLGFISPGELVPEFEQTIAQLSPGVLSEVFKSAFGWHLAEVLEYRQHDGSRELMRNQAREIIRERKREDELELWLRRLRDESFIEYRLDGISHANAP
ncbi:peptidylprolyl isomerase [Thiorhodospira sibirica]|uniref:peptidylprolyl isomerase n=1 Tax=Thiorhodospira sibirica TaxID=154347 RepID=UPI00022C52C1|nr:peptidylprolyl isomerase [Thiorhodospira sibirica]